MPDNSSVEGRPSDRYSTRELGRLIKFYKEKVRDCTSQEQRFVIKNIQSLINKGIELEDIVKALYNYEEARRGKDPQYTMMLRSFFSEARVREWMNRAPEKKGLPEIRFQATERPQPVIPELFIPAQEAEDIEL